MSGDQETQRRIDLLLERTFAGFNIEIDEIIRELHGMLEPSATGTSFEITSTHESMPDTEPIQIPEKIRQQIENTVSIAERRINETINQLPSEVKEGVPVKQARSRFEKAKIVLHKTLPFLVAAILSAEAGPGHRQNMEGVFEDTTRAQAELDATGITAERAGAYMPGMSEVLYKSIAPIGYRSLWNVLREIQGSAPGSQKRLQENPRREDAWRLYLGLPQQKASFGISKYHPQKSTENAYYYSIRNWFPRIVQRQREIMERDAVELKGVGVERRAELRQALKHFSESQVIKNLVDLVKTGESKYYLPIFALSHGHKENSLVCTETTGDFGVMGQFTLSLGHDEQGQYISYYDKWDLANNALEGVVGKPFEIYDRIYYNPETFEPIG